jgi:hypothetical protein
MGDGIGHGLYGDRRVPADGDFADHNLAALAPLYGAPRADGIYVFRGVAHGRGSAMIFRRDKDVIVAHLHRCPNAEYLRLRWFIMGSGKRFIKTS